MIVKWLSRELLFCIWSRRSERDLEACMRREIRGFMNEDLFEVVYINNKVKYRLSI